MLVRGASAGPRRFGRDPARRYALAAPGCVRHGLEEKCPCDPGAASAGRVGPRAITHFSTFGRAGRDDPEKRQDGTAIGSWRRAPTGRPLLVEDDHDASGGTPVLSSRVAWRRASAARRPLTGAHARMDVPVGEGLLGHAHDDQETFNPGRRLAPASPAVAVVGMSPDGALARRPLRASAAWPTRRSLAPVERRSGPPARGTARYRIEPQSPGGSRVGSVAVAVACATARGGSGALDDEFQPIDGTDLLSALAKGKRGE
jgi:hypothetical protein